MSRGKYSPNLPTANWEIAAFKFNTKGDIPPIPQKGETIIPEIHYGGLDDEGFDMYGYSPFDEDGNYIADGMGIDRNGYTETEYLTDDDIWADANGF